MSGIEFVPDLRQACDVQPAGLIVQIGEGRCGGGSEGIRVELAEAQNVRTGEAVGSLRHGEGGHDGGFQRGRDIVEHAALGVVRRVRRSHGDVVFSGREVRNRIRELVDDARALGEFELGRLDRFERVVALLVLAFLPVPNP